MARDTSAFNSAKYRGEQPLFGSGLARIEKVLELVGTGNLVLDVGCWDGSIAKLLKEQGNEVYGLDNSDNAVRLAREKGIVVERFNLESSDWPSFGIQFDVVFAGEIIEHVFHTDLFLQNIRRLLRDNGYLVLTTPNVAALGRRLLLLFGLSPFIETTARQHDAGHIRYFTKASLLRLLDENGFAVTDFASDVVNFTNSGNLYSKLIPKVLPTLGRSLIVRARKR